MNLTYNEIIERDGEEVGLAYEKLVAAHLEKTGVEEAERNLMAQNHSTAKGEYLCRRAERHAKQEIIISAAYDILPTPKPTQAVCPRCCSTLRWDFDQDTYLVTKGEERKFSVTTYPTVDTTVYSCPFCNKVIGVGIMDQEGLAIYNHPSLNNINWEDPINEYNINTVEL